MKTIIALTIAAALTGCASVHIEVADYVPPTQYCHDGFQGTHDVFASTHTTAAIRTADGVLVYMPAGDLEVCK